MSRKASVAVIILTYNESLHLRRALNHVQSFAQEVFVVASFSTDDTMDIARSNGAQVLQHPFQNQAKQFQWALDHAPLTAEWVMRLDADEVIEADLSQEIIARLPELSSDVTGVYLNR
ncbi:MAG TPA: glycosyltransferase [Terracidiphilus sp.]